VGAGDSSGALGVDVFTCLLIRKWPFSVTAGPRFARMGTLLLYKAIACVNKNRSNIAV